MILAIADDLTGALEVGAKFATHGYGTRVVVANGIATPADLDVLVVDTESRHAEPAHAFELVLQAARRAASLFPVDVVFKKTDSTLRGNIAAELQALQGAFPGRSIAFAPAYPALGRVVRDGYLYVYGKLLHETEFAADPFNPVRESHVKAVLGHSDAMIYDSSDDGDLARLAEELWMSAQTTIAAGTAALADALASRRPVSAKSQSNPLPQLRRCLVVNGSLHPASVGQIAAALQTQCFDTNWCLLDSPLQAQGLERAASLGRHVRNEMEARKMEGVIVFGGDTAHGIYQALELPYLQPQGELVPGVPLSRCNRLTFISKAGGFGPPDVLTQLRGLLT